jgi:hypothetical protein
MIPTSTHTLGGQMDSPLVSQIVLAAATLLASLGGYTLAGLNERRRDERALQRELKLRNSDRSAQLENGRHALQLETLLALQDALQLRARLTGKAMHFDHMQAREGKYTLLPVDLSEDMHANGVEVRRLTTRILDSRVRAAVDEFCQLATRLSFSPKDLEGLVSDQLEDRAAMKMMQLGDGYQALSDTLGEALRGEIGWHPVKPTTQV